MSDSDDNARLDDDTYDEETEHATGIRRVGIRRGKKYLKNKREQQRRKEINDRFVILSKLLFGVDSTVRDKTTILDKAIKMVMNARKGSHNKIARNKQDQLQVTPMLLKNPQMQAGISQAGRAYSSFPDTTATAAQNFNGQNFMMVYPQQGLACHPSQYQGVQEGLPCHPQFLGFNTMMPHYQPQMNQMNQMGQMGAYMNAHLRNNAIPGLEVARPRQEELQQLF